MTDITQLFDLDFIGADVSEDANGTCDANDLQAGNALDRIAMLRMCIVSVFGNSAAGDLFMTVPLLNDHPTCHDHEVDTPHRLAFQSDERLERAFELLRKVMPKNG